MLVILNFIKNTELEKLQYLDDVLNQESGNQMVAKQF